MTRRYLEATIEMSGHYLDGKKVTFIAVNDSFQQKLKGAIADAVKQALKFCKEGQVMPVSFAFKGAREVTVIDMGDNGDPMVSYLQMDEVMIMDEITEKK